MKNLQTLSALGKKARDGFCSRCGSGASSSGASATSSFSGSRDDCGTAVRQLDLAAAKQASVNKLVRLLGEEVKSDDKVLFDHCVAGRSRRNAIPNIFCGLPSRGLRRLFAVYGIDEVQTKAPYRSLDLSDEEARREAARTGRRRESHDPEEGGAQRQRQHRERRQCQHQHQHRTRSAVDTNRKRLLPAFAAAEPPAAVAAAVTSCQRH